MSSQLAIPALRDLPAHRLAARTEHLRMELRDAPRPVLSRRRALALAAFVLALLATLLATPAVGQLRDRLAHLFSAETRTFDDATGDAPASTLDIKSVAVSQRPNGVIDFLVTFAGDFDWTEDGPLVALDLDQNPDTGSAFYGTEAELVLQSDGASREVRPALYRADGWDFRRERHARAAWMLGPHEGGFSIKRSALGLKPNQGFNIVAGSVSNHPDTAPDFGTFNYQRVPGTEPPRLGRDRRAPKLFAYDSTGARGGDAKLQYWVLEGRGRTRQVIRIYSGTRILKTIWTPLADVNPFALSQTTWKVPPKVRGGLRYCVRSFDAAGNRSDLVCANLQVH